MSLPLVSTAVSSSKPEFSVNIKGGASFVVVSVLLSDSLIVLDHFSCSRGGGVEDRIDV